MLKIGVLVSGGGTNLQALLDKIESGYVRDCEIITVVSSRADAYALKRAKKYGIETKCISKKEFKDTDDYDNALLEHFKKFNVELVVLAGFLSILGEKFVEAYKNKIINVHPALIPSFCGKGFYGLKPHIKALEYGVKVTGATVHFVNNEPDAGPIILQRAVDIKQNDTPESLQERVMKEAEWELLPEAVKLFSEGRLEIHGRKVKII
ncbi:MAG: phosphoribosylglycinamide formyltransferase [Clostridia bacterium]|jgi:phosphoribosylglycinamide formyltransferase-1